MPVAGTYSVILGQHRLDFALLLRYVVPVPLLAT